MNRAEIERQYDVAGGLIHSPGKFEGEPVYLPHFYDEVMNGASDETLYAGDTPVDLFEVTEEDAREFPELEEVYGLALWESDQGFATKRLFMDEASFEAFRESMERAEGGD